MINLKEIKAKHDELVSLRKQWIASFSSKEVDELHSQLQGWSYERWHFWHTENWAYFEEVASIGLLAYPDSITLMGREPTERLKLRLCVIGQLQEASCSANALLSFQNNAQASLDPLLTSLSLLYSSIGSCSVDPWPFDTESPFVD